jgi:uncharacterized membrane protein (DUF485 family)
MAILFSLSVLMSAPDPTNQPQAPDWAALEAMPEFRSLLSDKARFIIGASVFFVIYYFSLLVLVGWFPEFMKKEVLGRLNVAYLFALSQFFMAWTLAYIYTRKAAGWDREAAAIIKDETFSN